MDELDPVAIRRLLRARHLGPRVEFRPQVDSTMTVLAELARSGAPGGTVLIAEHQSAGRGRLGRRWEAPPGRALLLSVLFRPAPEILPPERWGELVLALALGAAEAAEAGLPEGSAVTFKWPNDLLAGGSKLGGLIAEIVRMQRGGGTRAAGPATGAAAPAPGAADLDAGPDALVVGLGLNVHQSAAELPPGATSLALLRGARPRPGPGASPSRTGIEGAGDRGDDGRLTRNGLAAALLNAADRQLDAILGDGEGQSLVQAWAARLETLGRQVRVSSGGRLVEGLAESVAADGALVLRKADGSREIVRAGDVLPGPP